MHCPFCNAQEDERVEAVDNIGNKVLLVMFDCPFHFQFREKEVATDAKMQEVLSIWHKEKGEDWLESVGPIMKAREMRNIERSKSNKKSPG